MLFEKSIRILAPLFVTNLENSRKMARVKNETLLLYACEEIPRQVSRKLRQKIETETEIPCFQAILPPTFPLQPGINHVNDFQKYTMISFIALFFFYMCSFSNFKQKIFLISQNFYLFYSFVSLQLVLEG